MSVRVGTASWTDKTLIACKRFYPRGCSSAEGRLRYYASLFPVVEVDSSYYSMPAPATTQLWAERTPAGFTMNVKAFSLFTGHKTQIKVLHQDIRQALGEGAKPTLSYADTPAAIRDELWRRFIDALQPLRAAGKLGLVHFQFPPRVTCSPAGRADIAHCVERMPGHTLSVEVRHASWFDCGNRASTLAFLRELGVVHTIVDGPQGFANSVPLLWEVTHPRHSLVRLHGRNRETWNVTTGAASDRFNYDYNEHELAEIAAGVQSVSGVASEVHVVFNNNFEDQGQRNAATLQSLLRKRGL